MARGSPMPDYISQCRTAGGSGCRLLAAQKALPGQHVFGPAGEFGPRCHASGGK